MKDNIKSRTPSIDQFDKTQEFPIDIFEKSGSIEGVSEKLGDEYKLLKQTLQESKKCYQAMIETNLYGIMEIDISGIIVYANLVMHNILGYLQGELRGKQIWELLSSDSDREKLTNHLTNLASGKYSPFPWVGKFIRKDNKVLELQIDWNYRRDKNGRVRGFISVISDIVKSIPAPGDARNIEIKFRQIIESAKEIILTCNPDGNITYVNPAAIELIGYFEEELLNMNLADILPPDQVNRLKINMLDKDSAKKDTAWFFDASFITRELKLIPVEISSSLLIKDEQPLEILIIGRDICQQKRLERELIRSQKFEAITTFANGIVQDLHDYLTNIITSIDIAQMVLDPEGNIYKRLSDAKEGCSGIKELTRQFVIFSRGGAPMKRPASLTDMIKTTAGQILKGSTIQTEFIVSEDLWEVAFDERQIQQVMETLIINAREASPPSAPITIQLDNIDVELNSNEIPIPVKNGKYVKISIQNSGTGIAEEDIDRIFDPYFSTKKMRAKKGLGLGLTIAYSIIKRHQGYIYVNSKPGSKTTFSILLPAFRKEMRDKGGKKNVPAGEKNSDDDK